MSRKIDHKIWENPPHLFECQPGTKLVRLSDIAAASFIKELFDRIVDFRESLHRGRNLSANDYRKKEFR